MARPKSLHSIQESDEHKFINMLLFGHPGTGKTVFWSTGNESVLFLDSDPGLGTQTAKSFGSKAFVMPVTDYEELQEAYEYCKHDLAKDLPSVRWVVWDSLTMFQERTLIDDIMPDVVAENPRQEEFVPSRREYLMNMNRIGRYCRLFVELPFNFGVTCHVEIEKDEAENSMLYMPMVQGRNMPSKVAGYMNVVGYLGKAKVKENGKDVTVQRLLTTQVGKFYAKDRFHALGQHIDRPTLPKLEALIDAKRSASKSAAPTPLRRRRPAAG